MNRNSRGRAAGAPTSATRTLRTRSSAPVRRNASSRKHRADSPLCASSTTTATTATTTTAMPTIKLRPCSVRAANRRTFRSARPFPSVWLRLLPCHPIRDWSASSRRSRRVSDCRRPWRCATLPPPTSPSPSRSTLPPPKTSLR